MLTSDQFCDAIGVDTPSRVFKKTDPFGEPIEWFGWTVSRSKINGRNRTRNRTYTIHAEPSGMARAEFGKRYGYDMDAVDARLAYHGAPIIGSYVVRRWKLGRRVVYQAAQRNNKPYQHMERPDSVRLDPNICAVCGDKLMRNRRVTVNSVAHCVPCNRKAFVDLDKRARQVLKIDREAV